MWQAVTAISQVANQAVGGAVEAATSAVQTASSVVTSASNVANWSAGYSGVGRGEEEGDGGELGPESLIAQANRESASEAMRKKGFLGVTVGVPEWLVSAPKQEYFGSIVPNLWGTAPKKPRGPMGRGRPIPFVPPPQRVAEGPGADSPERVLSRQAGKQDVQDGWKAFEAAAAAPTAAVAAKPIAAASAAAHAKKAPGEDAKPRFRLHQAVRAGDAGAIAQLIHEGERLEERDKKGLQPLHIACSMGDRGMARTLLQLGADMDGRDTEGNTPLHTAAAAGSMVDAGRLDVLELLVDCGANLDVPNADCRTPLHVAAVTGNSRALARLLEAGAMRAPRDRGNKRPIDLAQFVGYTDIVEYLQFVDTQAQMHKIAQYSKYLS